MTRLLELDVELSERSRTIAVYCLNAIRYWQTSDASVVPTMAECVDFFHRDGDWRGESLALASLAVAQFTQVPPDLDAAEENYRRALALADEFDDAFGSAMVGVMLGRVWLVRGRLDDAFAQFERSLALARSIGDTLGEAIGLSHLGWARLLRGEHEGARTCFREQLLIASTIGHDEGIADAFEGLFACSVTVGDIELGGRLLGAAEDLRERKSLRHRRALLVLPAVPRACAGRARRVALRAGAPGRTRRRTRRRRRGRARLTGAANGRRDETPQRCSERCRSRRHGPRRGAQTWCMPGCGLGGSDSVNSPWGSEASWVSGCRSVDV